MSDVRLIERWLPIAALSEESVRERRSMTALPPIYYLHVWWARRPLVASRAAILASILPATADHDAFLQTIGIHGDPVASRRRIDRAKRSGDRFEGEAYTYKRAFSYTPSESDLAWIQRELGGQTRTVLDPTAGRGSIPFESVRLGFETTANDLNPVAATILKATVDFPRRYGVALVKEFEAISKTFVQRREALLRSSYPPEPDKKSIPTNYIWARTIACPYCAGQIPLSPNWRLNGSSLGVRVNPQIAAGPGSAGRICTFELVDRVSEHSTGTVSDGDATCPFPDCARVIDGNEIKRQAQAEGMGEQLFAVVYKRLVETKLKSGKLGKAKWERGYRAPRIEDDNAADIRARLSEKLPEWEALDVVPNEAFPADTNDDRPRQYGMPFWRDMYSPRQLLGHGLATEIFREMIEEDRKLGRLSEIRQAAYVYLSFSLDKLRDYNSYMARWHSKREVTVNTFDRHDFAFKWSYSEMAITIEGIGHDWAIEQTGKCIRELVVSGGENPRINGALVPAQLRAVEGERERLWQASLPGAAGELWDVGAFGVSSVCGESAAVLATVKDAARRAKRGGLQPSLTAAARDGLGDRRSGRQDGRGGRTTGWVLSLQRHQGGRANRESPRMIWLFLPRRRSGRRADRRRNDEADRPQ